MKTFLLDRALPALDRVGGALAAIGVALMVLMMGSTLWEVVARRVFNSPTLWANDVTYMMNGTIFLIGAGYALRLNGHVRIDFLSARLPVRVQHFLNLLFYVALMLPALAWLTSSAVNKAHVAYARGQVESMSAWEPLVWPFYTGIALGLVGFSLQVVVETLRHAIGVVDPDRVSPPSAPAPI